MTVARYDVRVDVTGCCPLPGRLEAAVTVVVPSGQLDVPRTVAFGLPGAGCSRRYFDITSVADGAAQPGGADAVGTTAPGYSQAAYHAEHGWVFVACDHLGVGQSTLVDPDLLRLEVLAAADDAVARTVVAGLRAGTLIDGVGPIDVAGTVGLGHSMGGCLLIVTQALHRTFDAVGVLGFSAIHTVLPSPGGAVDVAAVDRDEADLTVAADNAHLGDSVPFAWVFHWDDVPPAIVAQDVGPGYPQRQGPVPPWGSATIPPAAITMLTPGVVAAEAAGVEVPVLVAVGQRDVVPDPRAEPTAYRSSPDITVHVVPTMAHMHNLASSRARLWARVQRWGDTVVGCRE